MTFISFKDRWTLHTSRSPRGALSRNTEVDGKLESRSGRGPRKEEENKMKARYTTYVAGGLFPKQARRPVSSESSR